MGEFTIPTTRQYDFYLKSDYPGIPMNESSDIPIHLTGENFNWSKKKSSSTSR
jgi:hypothetical protein